MSDPIGGMLTITAAETGIQDSLKSNDPVEVITNIAELIAGFSAYLAKYSPIGAAATNGGAALLLAEKIELDYKQTGAMPTIDELLSLAGNLASFFVAVGLAFTPEGEASALLSIAANAIGGTQLAVWIIADQRGQARIKLP